MSEAPARAGDARALKVLIVEDEFFLALEMEMWLLDAGHQVVGHGVNTRTALAAAAEDLPDLALVDLRLQEGASGLEVAASLKERGVTCLFVTSTCAAEVGGDLALGCLHKPIDNAVLLDAVAVARAALRGEPAPRTPYGMHLYGACAATG